MPLPRLRPPPVAIMLLVVVGAIRMATWQGLARPVRIQGGSMAEQLTGEHYRLLCSDCGFPCCYDATNPPRDQRVICPNCGRSNDHDSGAPIVRGQRVCIDRLAYHWRSPSRWEVVAFRASDEPQRLSVKRILGLPGERVEIRDGDIYIDGQPQRKSLAELRSVVQLVHDNTFQLPSEAELPPRWRATEDAAGWSQSIGILRFQPSGSVSGQLAFLGYEHWPGYAANVPRSAPSPILDNYGYNQQTSRQLNRVRDVLLFCRLKTPARGGKLAFEIGGNGTRFRVTLDFEARIVRFRRLPDPEPSSTSDSGNEFPPVARDVGEQTLTLPRAAYARSADIELARCDGRILFGIDGRELIQEVIHESERAHGTDEQYGSPFRIGASGTEVTVKCLRVYRDIYYLPPVPYTGTWSAPVPLEDEVFVLGDNVPISQDSRQAGAGFAPIDNLLGPVVQTVLLR